MKRLFLLFFVILAGCTGVPEGLTVVDGFSLDRYLGTWHEIVRLDNRFEKELEPVSATYSLSADGSVNVVNRGYDTKNKKWKNIEGRAVFNDDRHPDKGALKVSFFGPFYASYNVIALDRAGYGWAMVCGRDKSYFWILSKSPDMDPVLLGELVAKAASLGFDTTKFRYVRTHL
ncbi:MAG: lipocalin [Chlorobiaceae bacterium]|nr:lipocalin [Chlorobiaceae bacterium]NTV60456.1 lipocalin [Chlorobiaceae bacterium]